MWRDTDLRFCTYTCTEFPRVPLCCHFATYYNFPEKKSVPELNDQPTYVKEFNSFFSLHSYFAKNTHSHKKTVSPAAALTLQRTVFNGLYTNHVISISTATGVWLITHTRVLYTRTKGRMKEISDYELWVVKSMEAGGRQVLESTITTFNCKNVSVVWFLGYRAFGSPSCKILSTRNKPWQPAAPMRFKQSGLMYSGNTLMTMTVQTVGFRLRHRVTLQVEADILDESPYERTKGTTNQKPTT